MTDPASRQKLKLRIFAQQQFTVLPAVPLLAFLFGILYQLNDREVLDTFKVWIPRVLVALGIAFPYALVRRLVDRALAELGSDTPGDRLRRILVLPRKLELSAMGCYLGVITLITVPLSLWAERSLVLIFPTLLVTLVILSMLLVRQTIAIEEMLRPFAVEELERHPEAHPASAGFLWPRQVWYLPYVTVAGDAGGVRGAGGDRRPALPTSVGGVLADLRRQGYEAVASEVPGGCTSL